MNVGGCYGKFFLVSGNEGSGDFFKEKIVCDVLCDFVCEI